jgi:hypothetical protein
MREGGVVYILFLCWRAGVEYLVRLKNDEQKVSGSFGAEQNYKIIQELGNSPVMKTYGELVRM